MFKTIAAYPGEEVILNSPRGFIITAPYVSIQGIRFVGGGITIRGHCEVIDNVFVGEPWWAWIDVSGDNNLVERNFIDSTGGGVGTQSHGIYVMYGSNNVVRGNTVDAPTGYGIHVYDERKSNDEVNVLGNESQDGSKQRCAHEQHQNRQ